MNIFFFCKYLSVSSKNKIQKEHSKWKNGEKMKKYFFFTVGVLFIFSFLNNSDIPPAAGLGNVLKQIFFVYFRVTVNIF